MNPGTQIQALLLFLILSATAAASGDAYKEFELAWKYFSNGNYDQAKTIVDGQLTAVDDLPDRLKANYLYLHGYLLGKEVGRETEAISIFAKAVPLYKKKEDKDGVYLAQMGMAKVMLDIGQLREADALLGNVTRQTDGSLNLAFAHYLYGRLAFLQGDYQTALLRSDASLAAYKDAKDERGIANAMMNSALFLMLTNQMEKGYELTFAAQKQIVKSGDTNKYFFSLINLIIYGRCFNGKLPLYPVNQVEIKAEDDKDLASLLAFAKSCSCP